MYRPCFRQLTISTIRYLLVPFNGVHSLLSAFFLSPYPVTLKLNLTLDKVCLVLHSTDPIPVPSLAINTEQQSKSLDVALYVRREFLSASPRILESNFPQYIVLKSLRIMNSDALCFFSKVKSIKVDEISFDINIYTDTDSLRSLLSSVSTNDMKIVVSLCWLNLYHQPTLEIIFNSLSPTKPPYLQLIAE